MPAGLRSCVRGGHGQILFLEHSLQLAAGQMGWGIADVGQMPDIRSGSGSAPRGGTLIFDFWPVGPGAQVPRCPGALQKNNNTKIQSILILMLKVHS